jgi:hypothetical protein
VNSRAHVALWLSALVAVGAIIVAILAYARHEIGIVSVRPARLVSSVEFRDFVNGPMGYYSSMFSGVFYAGSDDTCDYIAVRHGRFTVGAFKLRRGEVQIKNRMSLTSNETNWVDVTREFPPPAPPEEMKAARSQEH